MGKKSRLKKQRQQLTVTQQPAAMDPTLIKAYTSGRDAGIKEGKVEGVAEIMMLFNEWVEEIDQHVKGIGPKTKIDIEMYLGDRIKEAVNKNRIKSANFEVIKDLPKKASSQ